MNGYHCPQGFTVETLAALLQRMVQEGKGSLPILSTASQVSIEPVRSLCLREPYFGFAEPWVELET